MSPLICRYPTVDWICATQWPFATKEYESTYFLFTHLKRTIEINYLLLLLLKTRKIHQ